MEHRIEGITAHFKQLHTEYMNSSLSTNSEPKKVLKEVIETKDDILEVVKEVKKSFKDQIPMMLKKINRHRQELAKNNLKKQKGEFVFHGSIDDYEKELKEIN
jgi:hypothetical protein